ncbi:PilN domain-containing protein [Oryzibacter oryziterrae]|uniref:PilN domain-containing protein n=1 Tax=Oryzibacter oryziterrae TaxID=2766474 RepID=UPI001F1CE3AF|nr:PilN domain-containing protein [Oryzibacter oryziterrae]
MTSLSGHFASLLDAFVNGLAPLAGRFGARSRWVVSETAEGARLHAVNARGVTTDLGALTEADGRPARALRKLRGGRIELRIDPQRILTRTLSLPAAGKAYLDPIIEHRLDRLTPWRPEKVVFGYAAASETAADGTLAVDFAATSRDVLNEALDRLAAVGLTPTAVGSGAEPIDAPLRIDLLRGSGDPTLKRLRRASVIGLVLAFALLLPAAIGSYMLASQEADRVSELDQRLKVKRQVLSLAAGAGKAEGRDLELISAKTEPASVALLIDRLSALVPDDTYLGELSLEGDKLHLAGTSVNAPALIGLIEADPVLSDARFTAPVTRTDDGRDSFDLTVHWDKTAPTGAQAAVPASSEVQP